MNFPSWRSFENGLSKCERFLNEQLGAPLDDFKERHPVGDKVINVLISFLPPPFGKIAESIYNTSAGTDEDKSVKVIDELNKLRQLGEEHYVKITERLDMVLDTTSDITAAMAKEETALKILNILLSTDENIAHIKTKVDQIAPLIKEQTNAIHQTYSETRAVGMKVEETKTTVDELKEDIEKWMSQSEGKEDRDPYRISCAVLRVNKTDFGETMQNLEIVINSQMRFRDKEIPFVAPKEFYEWLYDKNLFFYGVTGCGKSRVLCEIIRNKIEEIDNIYVLNPPPSLTQSSEIQYGFTFLTQIESKLSEKDILVWKNFPDGLNSKDNIDVAKNALPILTQVNSKHVLVALKPSYNARYRFIADDFPELRSAPVSYSSNELRQILQIYGNTLFPDLYGKVIKSKESQILQALLQREESTPAAVLDYYQNLASRLQRNEYFDPITVAENLPSRLKYYKDQFNILRRYEERKSDVDFLCILKLCHYYLKLPATIDRVRLLQREIFGSNLYDPERRLDTWIQITGRYYGMSNVKADAIEINRERKVVILEYLSKKLWDVIPDEFQTADAAGFFLGSSLGSEGLPIETLRNLVVSYDQNRQGQYSFIEGLGKGAGYRFASLDKESQHQILDLAIRNKRFTEYLGFGIGKDFSSLERDIQNRVLDMAKQDLISAYFLCNDSTVFGYASLDNDLRKKVLELAKDEHNSLYAQRLGDNPGKIFVSLRPDLQEEIWDLADQISLFADHLGWEIGRKFSSLPRDLQESAWRLADKNESFAKGLGGLGYDFEHMNDDLRREALEFADKNDAFAVGLGETLGNRLPLLKYDSQQEVLKLITRSKNFALWFYGNLGDNFPLFDEAMQEKIWNLVKDDEYAYSLGLSISQNSFSRLKKEQQMAILERATKNSNLLAGLGYLRGFSYLEQEVQEKVWSLAAQNKDLAFILGRTLGRWFNELDSSLQEKVVTIAEENQDIAEGLGRLGSYFKDLRSEIQSQALELALKNNDYGYQLGRSIASFGKLSSIDEYMQKAIIQLARKCDTFAMGLGESLGAYPSFEGFLLDEVRDLEKSNEAFRYLFYFGSGSSWNMHFSAGNVMTDDQLHNLLDHAGKNDYFAAGLGFSFGNWFRKLSDTQQAKAWDFAAKNSFFAAGLGIAFRRHDESNKQYTDLMEKINYFAIQNKCFAAAIGYQKRTEDEIRKNPVQIAIEEDEFDENEALIILDLGGRI